MILDRRQSRWVLGTGAAAALSLGVYVVYASLASERAARWFHIGFVFCRAWHGRDCLRVPAGPAETLSGLAAGPREDVGIGACLARAC